MMLVEEKTARVIKNGSTWGRGDGSEILLVALAKENEINPCLADRPVDSNADYTF